MKKDKYDKPTTIAEIKGIGKLYKIPFAYAGLDIAKPDYYLFCNVDIKSRSRKKEVFKYELTTTKCYSCHHDIVKTDEGWKHIYFFGKSEFNKEQNKREYENFAISDICHREEEGSENSYSTWGSRCSCKSPKERFSEEVDSKK